MAGVFSDDIGSSWGLKKLFGEETEDAVEEFAAAVKAAQEFGAAAKAAAVKAAEEYAAAAKAAEACAAAAKAAGKAAKAAEELAAAIHFKQLYTAAAAGFEKESATSKVQNEGVRQLYDCLCYPKELLKKEDEEQYGLPNEEVLPKVFKLWAIKQRYDKDLLAKMFYGCAIFRRFVEEVELRKMFNEWATKHKKKYDGVYEWRLRFKIWLNTKVRVEQLCLKSGRMFSMNEMTVDADLTMIEDDLGNRGRVKPAVHSLRDVKKGILDLMGESWMKKVGQEFEKWAERHKRVYSSTKEREKRRLAYLDNMRTIQLWEEEYPGEWGFGNDLENMDQFPWEKDLVPPAECSRCRPRKKLSSKAAPLPKKIKNKAAPFLQQLKQWGAITI